MKKILLVEDDQNLSFMMKENLEDLNFEVYTILKGEEVFKILENEIIDLILMDVELPGELDGFETAKIVREKYPVLPIIFTTARNTGKDIEKGFSIDYMDYVKKPFGIKEIEIRINSLLGYEKAKDALVMIGSITFDPCHQRLYGYGQDFHLTNLESRFLAVLCENFNSMVSKDDIIRVLWGEINDPRSKENSIHNLAYKLRQYLKNDDSIGIEMLSKSGYRIMMNKIE